MAHVSAQTVKLQELQFIALTDAELAKAISRILQTSSGARFDAGGGEIVTRVRSTQKTRIGKKPLDLRWCAAKSAVRILLLRI